MSKRLTYEELEERVRELEASKILREQSDFDGLIDNLKVGVLVYGPEGAVIRSNATARMILGLTHDQMVGKESIDPAWTLLREDGSPLPVEEYPISRVMATKEPVCDMVAGIRHCNEVEPIWVLDTAIPEIDKNGQIVRVITTFTDISARKNSEEKYRNLFEHTMQEVHLWKLVRDKQGAIETWRLVDANPTALKAWGKSHSETIGKAPNEIFSYDVVEQFMPIVEKIFSEDKPYTWEEYFPPTGQYLYMTSVPFGEYFMSTGIDITDRRQAEEALRESEGRHRLFNNPLFGGSVIHNKGRILDCSGGLSDITGYSHDELIGMDGLLLIAPEWRDFVKDKITSGSDEPYEAEGIRKDGTIYPVRIHAKTIQYDGNSARVGEFRDISDIKRTEQALEESERLLRNIIDSSTDYIFVKDKDLRTLLCNETFARALNKEPFDLIGKTDIENGWDDELVKGNPEKGIRGYEKDDLEALKGKTIRTTETSTISGETLYLDSIKLPLTDENDTIFGILGISRDITEQKKAEEELRETLKEKDYLMKELNHRVKNNLLMVSSLINLKSTESEIGFSDIRHQIEAISLIHEKLYQSESVTEINCDDYFGDLLCSILSSFTKGDVKILKSIEDISIPTKIATTLGLVINEIATNAIKHGFTDKEDAVFSITMKRDESHSSYELVLSNSGNPFPLDVVFESSETLGLRLINALVAQLDGTVELKREPNPLFTIKIPIED